MYVHQRGSHWVRQQWHQKLLEKIVFYIFICQAVMLLNSAFFRTKQWWIISCQIMTSFPFPCNEVKHLRKKNPTSISNSLCFASKIDCDESNSSNQLCSMVLSEEKFQHTYHFKIYTAYICMYKLGKFWRATKHIFCYTKLWLLNWLQQNYNFFLLKNLSNMNFTEII